ncbi:MAG: serine--tRNA ligase [Candidatus Aminicenantes bacterium]|nr:serine--tRNA ligase [Candidatus Aminicenantes bacterium]
MLDRKYIQDNPELVRAKLKDRGMDLPLDDLLRLYDENKAFLQQVEELRFMQNSASKEIGRKKTAGDAAAAAIAEMKELSDRIKDLDDKRKDLDKQIRERLLDIPNLPDDSVPVGGDARNNVEIRRIGNIPLFIFEPKPHWDVGTDLGILDFERAGKITGARFAVYLGAGARLERALISFMLDLHTTEKGYEEVLPPFIANEDSLTGTGQLPKFEEDLFKLRGFPWYLIPTAEVPLANYYRGEILDGGILPRRFAAWTPCFRSEAGSYGKDVRGLIRQHQFNKVELVSFCLPENSKDELEKMTADAEDVLMRLGLPYRVIVLCTGDMGFAAAKTYDIEIWMPHRKAYLEISSVSNCTDFQARRADIRFKRERGAKPEFVHTLNGSGVAIGRTVSAILENNQQEDGSVLIPEALRPYMGGLEVIGT